MHRAFLVDIMICNRMYDSENMQDIWRCTTIKKVSWHLRRVASQEKKGTAAAREVSIRIDNRNECEKKFVFAADYKNPKIEYTLQNGDKVFVLGNEKLAGFDWESGKLPEWQEQSCTVTAWADNRAGILPHIYIQGE